MLKRLFDIFFSVFGLVVFAPLLLISAIWIKLSSTGSVFFKQTRVGRYGREFKIYKFRTMQNDAERQGRLTVGRDRRISRPGLILRKYKIDELPQLVNVVLGDMSLVGPRPEVPEFMACYAPEIRERILSVRPGITDWASIEMVDENRLLSAYENPEQAYIDIVMPIKQNLYLRYVDERSMLIDIKIIFATIFKIIHH